MEQFKLTDFMDTDREALKTRKKRIEQEYEDLKEEKAETRKQKSLVKYTSFLKKQTQLQHSFEFLPLGFIYTL